MTYRGINYDVGTHTVAGGLSREVFDINIITRELEIIRNELHCNIIRISGVSIERLVKAAEIALNLGLVVLFSPTRHYDNQENTFNYILQAAGAAEKLRVQHTNIILVMGCELSLFTSGFITGDTGGERMKNLFGPLSLLKNVMGIKRGYNKRLNTFLQNTVREIRKQFQGQVTYASGTWEKVDWQLFDIIGIDLYRASYNKLTYQKELRHYNSLGKPLCIMGFGCCAYQGAEDKGAMGWAIVDWKKERPELKGEYIRDEEVQARQLIEVLDILQPENVFAALAFTFISYHYVYNDDPRYDLDMASYGIVKAMPGTGQGHYQNMPWIPKRAFFELGRYYNRYLSE